MRRRARQRALLFAGVLIPVVVAGWQWRRDIASAPGPLLPRAPASIQRIALQIGTAPATHYQKRDDGHWWRTDSTPTRVDDVQLDQLASTAAAPVLRWQPLSAFDPARIGLQPPRARLTLDDAELDFGEISVTGPQTFVRVGERVALVSLRYVPRPAEPERLHSP